MRTVEDRDFFAALVDIQAAPRDVGVIDRIVRRPAVDEREIGERSHALDERRTRRGGWRARGSRATDDGSADPEAQLTMISTCVLRAIEPNEARWPLAGDQLYVDLDLRADSLPAGCRLAIGDAVIEVSATPHTGCAKFSARFGSDALRWINSPVGRAHRMRGVNARVLRSGTIRIGDAIRRL